MLQGYKTFSEGLSIETVSRAETNNIDGDHHTMYDDYDDSNDNLIKV